MAQHARRRLGGTAEAVTPHPEARSSGAGMFSRDFRYMVSFASQMISAIALTPVLTRVLGPQQFGAFSADLAVYWAMVWLMTAGLNVGISRVHAGPDGKRLAPAAVLMAALSAAGLAVPILLTGTLWAPVFGFARFGAAEHLTVCWAAIAAVTMVELALLRAQERIAVFAAISFMQSAGAIGVGIVVAASSDRTATDTVAGAMAVQAIALVVGMIAIRPNWRPLAIRSFVTSTLRFSVPIVPQQIGYFVITGSDRLIVQRYLGVHATGRYQVAYNVGAIAIALLTFLNQAWLPRIFAARHWPDRRTLLSDSRDDLYRLLIPVLIGMALGGPVALSIWAPSAYQTGSLTLVTLIVIASTVAWCAAQANTRALLAEGWSELSAIATVVAAAMNIGLNLVLVPRYGLNGSAVATLVSYAVLASTSTLFLRLRSRRLRAIPLSLHGMLLLSLGCVFATYFVPQAGTTWLLVRLAAAIACACWFAVRLRVLARKRPSATESSEPVAETFTG